MDNINSLIRKTDYDGAFSLNLKDSGTKKISSVGINNSFL